MPYVPGTCMYIEYILSEMPVHVYQFIVTLFV